jgi:hypothetical protein
LDQGRAGKLAAETLKPRHDGERKAWGLDAIAEDTAAGMSALDELDAMLELAMRKSGEMREAVRKERGGSAETRRGADL